ncbi:MAG: hypothetical protein ACT4OI_05565 [Methanobacteriota archaeon]
MPVTALDEADRILHEAAARRVTLRLLGGLAILVRCPSARSGALARVNPPDIDFAGLKDENARIKALFESLSYRPNQGFNALHGYKQLMFHGPEGQPKVDVFLDEFAMCHRLDLRPRLRLANDTLPLADLLFTKLQIVQINEKDVKDIIALLLDHPIGPRSGNDSVDGRYLADLAARDWGIYTTLTDNLEKVRQFLPSFRLDEASADSVQASIATLRELFDRTPKSIGWRLRAKVGRRVAWYELPEEPKAIQLGQGPP